MENRLEGNLPFLSKACSGGDFPVREHSFNDLNIEGNFEYLYTIAALPHFPEKSFLTWLRAALVHSMKFERRDAEALGRLILVRRWHMTLDELVYQSLCERDDVRPALRVCTSMLGLVTLWVLGLSPLSAGEKWLSLEETITKLYPLRQAQNALWKRIGQDGANLPQDEIAPSYWHKVLKQLRQNRDYSKIALVLTEMRRDFPINEHLKFVVSEITLMTEVSLWRRLAIWQRLSIRPAKAS